MADEEEKEKKQFVVCVREVHVASIKVTADTKEEAIAKVKEDIKAGEANCIGIEYSHTLDSDTWTAEEYR